MHAPPLALLLFSCSGLLTTAYCDERLVSPSRSVEDEHFRIASFIGGPSATQVLEQCQTLRREIHSKWIDDSVKAWSPRCEIVLHRSRGEYLKVVGPGGSQTFGSSWIEFSDKREVIKRRIDLLVDSAGKTTALAHELAHVILADRFGGTQPPRWLDEGIATTADSIAKQKLHFRDCRDAMQNGSAMRIFELVALKEFSSAQQVPAFYGQSLSLVTFLAEQNHPSVIIDFLLLARSKGYDHALQQCYGIRSLFELERQWWSYAVTPRQSPGH